MLFEVFTMIGITIAESSHPMVASSIETAYKQSGLEQRVNEKTGQLERKYISPDLKLYLGPGFAIGRALAERKIQLTWEF